MKQAATIIAETFGWDVSEAKESRYHYGRTRQSVFTSGNQYFAVSKQTPKGENLVWRRHPDQFFASANGTILWVADVPKENTI